MQEWKIQTKKTVETRMPKIKKEKQKKKTKYMHEMNEKRIRSETENVLTVSWEWNRKYEYWTCL